MRRSPCSWNRACVSIAVAFADSSIVVLALPELFLELDNDNSRHFLGVTAYTSPSSLEPSVSSPSCGAFDLRGSRLALALSSPPRSSAPFQQPGRCFGAAGSPRDRGRAPARRVHFHSSSCSAASGNAQCDLGRAGTLAPRLGRPLGCILTEAFDWGRSRRPAPLARRRSWPALAAGGCARCGRRPECPGAAWLGARARLHVRGVRRGALPGGTARRHRLELRCPLRAQALSARCRCSRLREAPLGAPLGLATSSGARRSWPRGSRLSRSCPRAIRPTRPGARACGRGSRARVARRSTRASLVHGATSPACGTTSVGVRHVGLVVGLLAVAPLLSSELEDAEETATLTPLLCPRRAAAPNDEDPHHARPLCEFQRGGGEIPDLSTAVRGERSRRRTRRRRCPRLAGSNPCRRC